MVARRKYRRNRRWRRPPLRRIAGSRLITRRGIPGKPSKISAAMGTSYGAVAAPFPQKMYTVFSYSEDFQLTNAVAQVPVSYTFRGNSINDPNKTGVGIQPRYYDTLLGADGTAAPYQRYRVLASQITVKAFARNTSLTPGYNGLLSVTPVRGAVTGPSTITEMRERAFAKCVPVSSLQSWKPYTVSNFMKTKTMFGIKDTSSWDTLDAAYNGNPASAWDWIISMCPIGQADAGMNFDFLVSIKYYVALTTFNDVADS